MTGARTVSPNCEYVFLFEVTRDQKRNHWKPRKLGGIRMRHWLEILGSYVHTIVGEYSLLFQTGLDRSGPREMCMSGRHRKTTTFSWLTLNLDSLISHLYT